MNKLPIPIDGVLTSDMLEYDKSKPQPYYIFDCGVISAPSLQVPAIVPEIAYKTTVHLLCVIDPADIKYDNTVDECVFYVYAKYNFCLGYPTYHCFRYVHYQDSMNFINLSNKVKSKLLPEFSVLQQTFKYYCDHLRYGKFTFIYPYAKEYPDSVGKIYMTRDSINEEDSFPEIDGYVLDSRDTFIDIDANDEDEVKQQQAAIDFISEAYEIDDERAKELLYDTEKELYFLLDEGCAIPDNFVALVETSSGGDGVASLSRIKHVFVTPRLRNCGIGRALLRGHIDSTLVTFNNSRLDHAAQKSGAVPIMGIYHIPHAKTSKE